MAEADNGNNNLLGAGAGGNNNPPAAAGDNVPAVNVQQNLQLAQPDVVTGKCLSCFKSWTNNSNIKSKTSNSSPMRYLLKVSWQPYRPR